MQYVITAYDGENRLNERMNVVLVNGEKAGKRVSFPDKKEI